MKRTENSSKVLVKLGHMVLKNWVFLRSGASLRCHINLEDTKITEHLLLKNYLTS